MPKINVYVPDDLFERMQKVSKRQKQNWSKAACVGIEIRMGIVAAGKHKKTKADIVSRLRGQRFIEESDSEYKMAIANLKMFDNELRDRKALNDMR